MVLNSRCSSSISCQVGVSCVTSRCKRLCCHGSTDDIEIIFKRGLWEAKGEFCQSDVHRQIAIVFRSPPYQDLDIVEDVDVSIVLRRLSDRMDSEPVTFTYQPYNSGARLPDRQNLFSPLLSSLMALGSPQTFPATLFDLFLSALSYTAALQLHIAFSSLPLHSCHFDDLEFFCSNKS